MRGRNGRSLCGEGAMGERDGLDSTKPPLLEYEHLFKNEASVKKSKTPTFLLELPLVVDPGQAKRIRAHLEAARCLYNALLGEARTRLRRMQADPAWQAARRMPKMQKQQRKAAFSQL